jgi:hypothetical protein
MSRLLHFLDSRLTDGGEIVSLAPAALYPQTRDLPSRSIVLPHAPVGIKKKGKVVPVLN